MVVYSRYPSVRLYLDDRLIGEKSTDRSSEFKAVFTIPYTAGTLKAAGVADGVEQEATVLTTASEPYAIRMTTDTRSIKAGCQDISCVRVEVVDRQGRPVPNASNLISFSIKGAGTIQAIGNADITDTTPFTSRSWKAWKGELLVAVRSGEKAGTITLNATAKGLKGTAVRIKVAKY